MTAQLIVQNYGTFWERSRVFGNKGPGGKGSLTGFRRREPAAIDFRAQRGIYILYEGAEINTQRVVYVGQTGSGGQRLLKRLRDHTNDHLWNRWQRFSWLGFEAVSELNVLNNTSDQIFGNVDLATALDQVESLLIHLLEPLLNRQGAQWHGARQYFQIAVEESED